MRTVLHIGMSKTGTTALQTCFHASYDTLIKKGVLYPRTGHRRLQKHVLVLHPVLAPAKLPRSLAGIVGTARELDHLHDHFVEKVRSQVGRTDPRCMVLSAENLMRRLSQDEQRQVSEELRDLGASEVEVAVYLRRPSSFYLSNLQQKLRNTHKIARPAAPDYRRVLESYATFYGVERVRPRVFDRSLLVDGDIVADFCAAYLADEDIDPRTLRVGDQSNESISGESMAIVHRYRADMERENAGVRTRASRSLHDALREAEAKLGAPRPRLKEEIAEMVDYSSPDLLWLRDTFGIEFPGLDYARLERGETVRVPERDYSIEDLVEIDPALKRALLQELVGSRWTGLSGEVRTWVKEQLRQTVGA